MSISVGSVTVDVLPDMSKFNARITEATRNITAKVLLDVDTAAARAKIDEMGRGTTATVNVDVDDAAAKVKLDELARSRTSTLNVDVDTGGGEAKLAALGASAATAGGGMSGLATAALTLGPALIPLGAVAAAGIGAIGPLALAGASGLGVLALAFSGVAGTVKLLGQQHDAVAAQAAKSATSQAASAAAIASAEASLANTRANAADAAARASESVEKAKSSEVRAEQDAADNIAEATQSLSDARQQAAREVQDATEQVASAEATAAQNVETALGRQEQAEKSLSAAQKDQRQAQEDLTQSRKDAQRQLEDLTNSVTDNQLSQRDAALDIADAQKKLDSATADPKSSTAAIARLQLTYDQAVQRQKELATQGDRLAAQQSDASAKGVEGSDLVAAAQQRLVDANDKVADSAKAAGDAAAAVDKARVDGAAKVAKAQQDLADTQVKASRQVSDAQAAVVKAQTDGAEKVAAAQTAVSDALTSQATQARQSAFAISQAQAAVASAMQSSGSASNATLDGINAKLAATGAATLTFASFVRDQLSPAFKGLQEAAASGLLPGVQAALENLLPLMPGLTGFVGDLAKTMGDLFVEASKALTDPFWTNFFSAIGSVASPILSDFVHTLENIGKGFAGIIQAFIPMSLSVGGGIVDLTGKFAAWGASLKDSSGFQSFVSYIQDNWPKIEQIIGNVAGVIGHVVEALAPIGSMILTVLVPLTAAFDAIPIDVLSELAIIIGTVVAGFLLWNKALLIYDTLMDANPIGLVVIAIAALAAGVIYAYTHFQWFHDAVQVAWEILKIAFGWVQDNWPLILEILTGPIGIAVVEIVKHWDAIKGAFQAAWDWVSNVFVAGWQGAGDRISSVLTTVKNWISDRWDDITGAFQAAFDWVSGFFQTHWLTILGILTGPVGIAVTQIIQHWDDIKGAFTAAKDWVVGAFGKVWSAVKDTLTAPISGARDLIAGFLGAEGNGLQKLFSDAVAAIGTIWSGLQNLVKEPIRFIVDTVINGGLIDAFNWIVDKLHLPKGLHLDHFELPKGFAEGGYTGDGGKNEPKGVVHGGEFVFPQESVQRLGVGNLGRLAGLPGYSLGGLVGGAWNWATDKASDIGGFFADAAGWLTDPIGHLKSAINGLMGDVATGPVGDILTGAASKGVDWVGDAISNLFGGGGNSGGSSAGGGSAGGSGFPSAVERWRSTVDQVLTMLGQSTALDNGVLSLIRSESGGNPNAINLTDSNARAGHPSQGLMQTIPTTFAAYAGPLAGRGITDGMANIYAGVSYALKNYGASMLAAGGRHNSGGSYIGYDSGGLLPPGPSLVYNGLGHDEIVAPSATFADVMSGFSGGGHTDARSYPLTVMAPGPSTDELVAAFREEQRMQEFLHG